MASDWQDKTDTTLKRIEEQTDDTEIQTGYASNFRERVLVTLVRLEEKLIRMDDKFDAYRQASETFMEESKKDRAALNVCVNKIPGIETGLNNHLAHHDTYMRYIVYPTGAAILLAALVAFAKVILHVF